MITETPADEPGLKAGCPKTSPDESGLKAGCPKRPANESGLKAGCPKGPANESGLKAGGSEVKNVQVCCLCFKDNMDENITHSDKHDNHNCVGGSLGGCSGSSNDLLDTFDPRITSQLRELFMNFSNLLTCLITGICVASIANVTLSSFVNQIQFIDSVTEDQADAREFMNDVLPIVSAVTLVATSAAASESRTGVVQTVLAGVIGAVRLVSTNVNGDIRNFEELNITISIEEWEASDALETLNDLRHGVAIILVLTFTALFSTIVRHPWVCYVQCLVAHSVNYYVLTTTTGGTFERTANIILFAFAIATALTGIFHKFGVLWGTRKDDSNPHGEQHMAEQQVATLEIVSTTAVASITAFSVLAGNVYTLAKANTSGSLTSEIDFAPYLAPTVVVVARSFVHMKRAYEIFNATIVMKRIESQIRNPNSHSDSSGEGVKVFDERYNRLARERIFLRLSSTLVQMYLTDASGVFTAKMASITQLAKNVRHQENLITKYDKVIINYKKQPKNKSDGGSTLAEDASVTNPNEKDETNDKDNSNVKAPVVTLIQFQHAQTRKRDAECQKKLLKNQLECTLQALAS